MAGRQAHGTAPSKKVRAKAQPKKRGLDAFAIASHENPDKIKMRRHRLGATEGGGRPRKRQHNEDDEDEDEEGEGESTAKKQRKGPERGRFDELDLVEGSDSEGNEWKLGEVDSDDDSDLDSDEAFGESDEERFEGFGFAGSSSKKKSKKSQPRQKNVNLDEDDDGEESDSELEEGDLGEGAVDLATMLDASEESDEEMAGANDGGSDNEGSSDEEDDSDDMDDESSNSSADDDEISEQAKQRQLQNLIASLPQTDKSSQVARDSNANELSKPSNFGFASKTKLTLDDLSLPAIRDPNIKKSLKLLESNSNGESKRKSSKRLEVPLAKRQQDRLDRTAAYDKTKETLDRWTDTVKHNRRADHLIFPLPNNDTASAHENSRLMPTGTSKPFNELEATIQSILEESGLATQDGKDDEDRLREFEDLETKKMTIEEVKVRRDQLRMARELLFREEAKSKRIKKIKSKSYRKVHRRQREKEERLNQEALEEGGYAPSEDELEAQDRRRATERMGAKHRASKWAKSTKETGRAAWDEDARSGVTEMARRDEELRKRVEGRAVRKEFADDSESSDPDNDVSDEDENAEQIRLLKQLNGLGDAGAEDPSVPGSKLANMKFMLKAEANRKKQNDVLVEEMRRELAGEEPPSEEEVDIGRRVFGHSASKKSNKEDTSRQRDSQEPFNSDEEERGGRLEADIVASSSNVAAKDRRANGRSKPLTLSALKSQPEPSSEGGAWSKVISKSTTINDAEATRRRHAKNNAIDVEELDVSKAAPIATKAKPKKAAKSSTLDVSSDESDGESSALPFAIRDQDLIKRAFAGADVVGEFEAEKRQTIEDEDEKVVDNTIPGWGSWTGDGLSKKERARNSGRFLTKSEGIKEQNRKDAKLERVIINEKRVKKVSHITPIFDKNSI